MNLSTIEQVESIACSLAPDPAGTTALSMLTVQQIKMHPDQLIKTSSTVSGGGATELRLSERVTVLITVQDDLPMLPGEVVERMGRTGWVGRILQIKGTAVLVQ